VRPEWVPRSVLQATYEPESFPCAEFNPDWSYVTGGPPCVSQLVREIIEGLEPDVHQLFPVDMLAEDGSLREPRRYLLNVCSVVEGIIGGHYTRRSNGEPLFHPGALHPMAIRKSRVSKLHMWLDRRAPPSAIFVSDAFYRKLEEHKVGAFDLGIGNEK
jgi:Immunity protein family (Imm11)